jgi:rSAM/selenodomain-associated transferase 1
MTSISNRNALIVVAKRPAAGQTKTRLSPPLSPEEASGLYECMLKDTLNLMRQLDDVTPVLAYLPEEEAAYFRRLAPGFELITQRGHNLGARLDNATTHFLERGYERVVVMDSDSPTLPLEHLTTAFELLSQNDDIVIGPCDDGGYYLIGLRRPAPRLLREVQMSTPFVTRDTLALAAEEGRRVHLLPTWYDVDEAASLARLQVELVRLPETVAGHTRAFLIKENIFQRSSSSSAAPSPGNNESPAANLKVSVIIPALNEAGNILHLVNEVRATRVTGAEISVIVVDNGSSDATTEEARSGRARVVQEPRRGYGYACAAGVAAAEEADALVFMDGDFSSLPSELPRLLEPLISGQADLCLGSRELGEIQPGAMPPHQRFGNRLVSRLMRMLYGVSVTDLSPYRAIRRDLLLKLGMQEMTYGWPTEMTVKAARHGIRIVEAPVSWHKRREGESKVGGTLRGTALAAWYILGVTLRYSLKFGHPEELPKC